jgi:peptidoglycan/xylan/chitin deacetylase (PgdA/CDA1 family)
MLHKTAAPPRATTDPFDYIEPVLFEQRLSVLKERCPHVPSLDTIASGKSPLSGFALTFDDGYRDTVTTAMPILNAMGLKATVYVVVNKIGGTNDWCVRKGDVEEPLADVSLLNEWLAEGHEIGSHTLSHANLRKCEEREARAEIVDSRKRLEDLFGVSVRHFAYPFGFYNDRAVDFVREADYVTAVTVKFGFAACGVAAFQLPRIPMLSTGEWVRKAWHRLPRKLGL